MSFGFTQEDRFDELPKKIRDYLPNFFENRKQDFLDIENAFKELNFQTIRDYCHKQLGVAQCYNCFRLHEIVTVLQVYAREENEGQITAIYPELKKYLNTLQS